MSVFDDLGVGVQVKLKEDDDFLKVKETLTRIGIASKTKKTLYQSCHILHKQGEYAIVHFKELFQLDGKPTDFSDADKSRRNTIADLLHEWGLVDIIDEEFENNATLAPLNQIKILPFSEKKDWTLVTKYNIGKRKS